MRTLRTGLYPAGRLQNGAAILAAAEGVDVSLVQKRLDAFASAHRAYTEAQSAIEAAEAKVRGRQAILTQRDAEQDEALQQLMGALIAEGRPKTNPFEPFGIQAPSAVKKFNFGEKAKTLHTLAATLHADTTVSKATHRAAQAAEQAAQRMEAELTPFDQLQGSLRTAREVREAVGKTWDNALKALKRGARAAADDGAPGLYNSLFGRLTQPKNKPDNKPENNAQNTPAPPTPAPPAVNAA
jgi:hypothetical protein